MYSVDDLQGSENSQPCFDQTCDKFYIRALSSCLAFSLPIPRCDQPDSFHDYPPWAVPSSLQLSTKDNTLNDLLGQSLTSLYSMRCLLGSRHPSHTGLASGRLSTNTALCESWLGLQSLMTLQQQPCACTGLHLSSAFHMCTFQIATPSSPPLE